MKPEKFTMMALDNKHYLRLYKRYPQIRIKDLRNSVGLTIPKENAAYVRWTSDYEENKDTYRHEMEELLASRSQHEINGVRYKSLFGKIGKWVEKTFVPEKVKKVVADTPILNDIVSRGWLGPIPQQLTPEGVEAYEKGTGTSGLVGKGHQIALGAIPGVGPLLAAGYGAMDAPEGWKGAPMGAVQGYGLGSLGAGLAGGTSAFFSPTASTPYGQSILGSAGGPAKGLEAFLGGAKQGMSNYFNMPGIGGLYGVGGKIYNATGKLIGMAGDLLTNLTGGGQPPPPSDGGWQQRTDPQGNTYWFDQNGNVTYQNPGGKTGTAGSWGNIGKMIAQGGNLLPWLTGGGAALGMATKEKPSLPELAYDPEQNIKSAQELQKKYGLEVPASTAGEIKSLMVTSLDPNSDDMKMRIDTRFTPLKRNFDKVRQATTQRYTGTQPNVRLDTNTQYQQELKEVDEMEQRALNETIVNEMDRALDIKKWAITQDFANGKYNNYMVMELADAVGMKDQLSNALKMTGYKTEAEAYNKFQEIMALVLSLSATDILSRGQGGGQGGGGSVIPQAKQGFDWGGLASGVVQQVLPQLMGGKF